MNKNRVVIVVLLLFLLSMLWILFRSNAAPVVVAEDETETNSPGLYLLTEGFTSKEVITDVEKIPLQVLDSAENFISTTLTEEDKKNTFLRGMMSYVDNYSTKEYVLVYDLKINGVRENGKRVISGSLIRINVDENGTILNRAQADDRYNRIKNGGVR